MDRSQEAARERPRVEVPAAPFTRQAKTAKTTDSPLKGLKGKGMRITLQGGSRAGAL